jgi:hypothetical protein
LSEVSQINFISEYTVPQKYSSISEQTDLCRLISFQEAVSYEHFKLVWTMSCILPDYAVPQSCEDWKSCLLSIRCRSRLKECISSLPSLVLSHHIPSDYLSQKQDDSIAIVYSDVLNVVI